MGEGRKRGGEVGAGWACTCGSVPYVFTISMFQLTSHAVCQKKKKKEREKKGAVVIINLLTKGKCSHLNQTVMELGHGWWKHLQSSYWVTFSEELFGNCNTCSWKKIKRSNTSLRSRLLWRACYTLPVSPKHRMLSASPRDISLCGCFPSKCLIIWALWEIFDFSLLLYTLIFLSIYMFRHKQRKLIKIKFQLVAGLFLRVCV